MIRGDVGPESGAVVFTGYLRVPEGGDYTFSLTTDSGAVLRIHEANIIDADFGYVPGSEISANVRLAAGLHPFRLNYNKKKGSNPKLGLKWSGPSVKKETVSIENLFN